MRRAPKRDADGWKHDDPHDPLSDSNAPRRPRAKKDTRKWCKGKKGVEHTPELVVHHTATRLQCGESNWAPHRWWCRHAIRCSACGKYLNEWLTREECPDAG